MKDQHLTLQKDRLPNFKKKYCANPRHGYSVTIKVISNTRQRQLKAPTQHSIV